MNGWLAGARNSWATRSVLKTAEATSHFRSEQDGEAFYYGWPHVLRSIIFQTVEIFGALGLFIGVIFLLIWILD